MVPLEPLCSCIEIILHQRALGSDNDIVRENEKERFRERDR